MQILPNNDYERKNIFDWTPFDILHWLRNIQDLEEYLGNEPQRRYVKNMADAIYNKIQKDSNMPGQ